MNRIDRLIAVLNTLQSKRFVSADFIAEKYEISIRTVFRDLKALGEIGVPIMFEDGRGYSISPGYFLPPISLTNEEANAIILISSLSERYADNTTKKNIENALNKIKAVLRSTVKSKTDQLQSQIRIYNPPEEGHKSDFLTQIQNAILNKQILKIDYTNNQSERSQREVEAIGLTFYSNQWHLIAWCWKRNEYRDFKVNQISKLSYLDVPFKKSEHLDLNSYIKSLQ